VYTKLEERSLPLDSAFLFPVDSGWRIELSLSDDRTPTGWGHRVVSYHRRYKLKDGRFGLLALTLREKASLTQAEMSIMLGVSERTIRHWEGGTAFPTTDNLKRLIEIYLHHGAFVGGREREEAQVLWEQAAESAAHRCVLFDEAWFDDLLKQQSHNQPHNNEHVREPLAPQMPSLLRQIDWGEATDAASFYGRESELATLQQWVLNDRCRLVILLGIGGIGKTTLSIRFAQQVASHFEFVFWRSLRNAPPFEEMLADCIQTLSEQQDIPLPGNPNNINIESCINRLIRLLQERRCLLVFDNVETLLQAGSFEGRYREGYEGYALLIQRVAERAHQSCLLLTGREMLGELEPLEGTQSPVRALKIFGLERTAIQQLLEDKKLFGVPQTWDELVRHHAGNPLALKLAAATIQEVFGGNIEAFLREGPALLHTVRQLLDYQFERLSPLERDLMYWLAVERDLVPLEELDADLIGTVPRREVLAALKSLRWRCLVERVEKGAVFTLQPVVLEYVSERMVELVCDEIIHERPSLLLTHALMKAQSKEYIRDSQVRMLIRPILKGLMNFFGDEQHLEQHFMRLVQMCRDLSYAAQGYGGGNIVNLLVALRGQIKAKDFSHLVVRQAYLQGIQAQNASFAGADVSASLFTEPVESIASMALSPDGNYLAVGSFSGQIRLWHAADGRPVMTFREHSRMAWALAFSPDSTMLASGGYDRSVKLWKVEGEGSGRCIKTLQGHEKWVRSVAFSPDGTLLATSGMDQTIRLWDVQKGTCLKILYGHIGPVWAVAFSPDGTLLVTSGGDKTVRLWDVQRGNCLRILRGHSSEIMAVAFHPQGKLFASGGEDGRINLWNVRSDSSLATLDVLTSRATTIAFSPEGDMLASGGYDGAIEVWKIEGEREHYRMRTLHGHSTSVSAVAFYPGGLLISVSYSGKVKHWEVESGKCLRTLQGYSSVVRSVAFTPDGNRLIHGDDNGMLRVWEVGKGGSGRCLKAFYAHAGPIWSVICSPDGKIFASGGDDESIKLWKVEGADGESCLKTLRGHATVIWSVAFSPDGRLLASGNHDRTVQLWDIERDENGACLMTLSGHASMVWSVAFSPNGHLLASGDNDGEIRLWEVDSGRCIMTLRGETSPIGALVFSPDGKTLISSSNDARVSLWDMSNGQRLKTLPGQGFVNWFRAMAFSRDGMLLAAGTNDHSVELWQAEGQDYSRYAQMFAKHSGQVWSVAFSFNGSMLASGDDDGTIIVSDTQTGTSLQTLRSERPYERMNIHGVKGITEAQKASLKALGAIETTL
jgi:WD40 repeat protein/transcriptional regulator with XRE-family HTH domain